MSSCGVYQCQEVEEYCDNVLHVCTACRDICPYPYDIEEHRPQIVDCENFCPEYSKKLYGESTPTTTGVTVALAVTTAPTPAGLSTALIAGTVVSVILAGISLIALGICCIHRFRRKAHHKYGNYHEPDRYDSSSVKPLHERPSNQDEEHFSLGGNPVTQVSDGEQHSCNILPSVTIENDSLVRLNLHGPDSPEVDFVGATAAAIYIPAQPTTALETSSRLAEPVAIPRTNVSRDHAVVGLVDKGNDLTPLVRSDTSEGSLRLEAAPLEITAATAVANVSSPPRDSNALPEGPMGRVSRSKGSRSTTAVTSLGNDANQLSQTYSGPFANCNSGDTVESSLCLQSSPPEGAHDITDSSMLDLRSTGRTAHDSGIAQSTLIVSQRSDDSNRADSNNPPFERWDPPPTSM